MTRGRRQFVPPPGSTGSPLDQQASRPKPNRLSRSSRQTQAAAELGSPKSQKSDFKTPTRTSRFFSAESPHNDSDFQQDIVWDAGSPSPGRPGKRGQTLAAVDVDISDIVSRIAPKHGRPRAAEPTLQQWIGDSATIPCTPDVQAPKPKRRSPRPTAVDDLLKLAKQFDLNMFHQDKEENVQSLELPEETGGQNQLPGTSGTDVDPAAEAGVHLNPDLHVEDDLDFLFDGPTQHVSGTISQLSPLTHVPTAATGPGSKGTSPDDWDNDDLLNDSLVIEMTQNPQNFVAPNHWSSQNHASGLTPEHVGVGGSGKRSQSFKLESSFSVRPVPKETWMSMDPHTCRSELEPNISQLKGTCSVSTAAAASNNKPTPSFEPSDAAPAVSDLLDEDLDLFFSTDPVWDDPADDHLLCEVCEDLENRTESDSIKVTFAEVQVSKQRAALSNRTRDKQAQDPAPSGGPAAGGSVSVPAGVLKDSVRNSQTKTSSGTSCRVQSAAAAKDQFTFKRPNNPFLTVSNKGLSKCSAAEIELKKQQAMERRRQRLKAAQNL